MQCRDLMKDFTLSTSALIFKITLTHCYLKERFEYFSSPTSSFYVAQSFSPWAFTSVKNISTFICHPQCFCTDLICIKPVWNVSQFQKDWISVKQPSGFSPHISSSLLLLPMVTPARRSTCNGQDPMVVLLWLRCASHLTFHVSERRIPVIFPFY